MMEDWMLNRRLEIVHHKTEMDLVSNVRKAERAKLELDGSVISSTRHIEY